MPVIRYSILSVSLLTLFWLFALGGTVDVARWAADGQQYVQRLLADSIRAVRAGEPGAIMTLMGLCAAYGFFHAAGPGHGKLIIGGYGAAARITAIRLSVLAIVSSLAQALTAIALVALGSSLLGWGRVELTQTADHLLAPASYLAIAAVGLWLVVRGARKLRSRDTVQSDTPDAKHTHEADGVCSSCGHAHAPTVDQVNEARSFRDAAAIVASIALRPCTGAIFLLILCFGIGIPIVGIAGALIMGLGTASVTVLVAIASVSARVSLLESVSGPNAGRMVAFLEIVLGGVVAIIALTLVLAI